MLPKFLIPTVIASILILLTTLTTITEEASVNTLTSTSTTAKSTTTLPKITKRPAATAPNISATVIQLTKTSDVNKFLKNAAEETTTSLLPLQPPLNVTSTTLASFILNQKHQQQQRQRKQQQLLYLKQQRQYRQLQDVAETKKQHQQQQPQIHEHLLNDNVNDNQEIKKKNLDSSFVTVKSAIDVITAEPSSTHAYIPFDLDYNDPTEEKAAQQINARQSTIKEVLSNLFPKGFSDIFRFSYAGEQADTTIPAPIIVIKSTPTPFKAMPSRKVTQKEKPQNNTFITVSTTVTKEIRREISPGHTEIVVEQIITDPGVKKSSDDFKDGSNSISKDELLRINRAAREASVLPSLLVNPQSNCSSNSNGTKSITPIVILNEGNNNDDFVDAPEDDNHIAETQDVIHQVLQPPPAESTNFHATPTHQYNVRIIHDNSLRNNENKIAMNLENSAPLLPYNSDEYNESTEQNIPTARRSPSYQAFVEQSKYLQNSLQEAPSRKFLKNFQNSTITENKNPAPVSKGNFHYEQVGQQNHIQTVAPAAQLQYLQFYQQQLQDKAEHKSEPQPQNQAVAPASQLQYVQFYQDQLQDKAEYKTQPQSQQYQQLHTQITSSQLLSDKDIYQIDSAEKEPESTTPANLVFVTLNTLIKHDSQQPTKMVQTYAQEPQMIQAKTLKSPHEFVSDAVGYSQHSQKLVDPAAEQTEDNPKPSNGGYTFVEVQKSINIHNKLITEKDGRLVEQHETIYPEQKYGGNEEQLHVQQQQQQQALPYPALNYVSLSQNPIHVEQLEEQYESAASIKEEQHAPKPVQQLEDFGSIQQSNLIQESHIIEIPQQVQEQQHAQYYEHQQHHPEDHPVTQKYEQQVVEDDHLTGEILPQSANIPQTHNVQIPYVLPIKDNYQPASLNPVVVQEIVEKHIPVPYGVPEPVGIPIHIQHFIDRPYPVETIVEKPVPYSVEKVVEKIVEKHVPVEVEKIVEKPVEVIVKKYIDRPVAIPIKIPVSLHLPAPQHGSPPPAYGSTISHYPPAFGGGLDHASTWPQAVNAGTFTRVPSNILKAYYVKMLKKLVPQMQQAYKNAHSSKGVPKITQKPYNKPRYKISDILYDLKPPPPRSKLGPSWDVGARYQYDYNTLPIDLSASSSIAVSKSLDRPGQGYKTNVDEFQRWRNGHSLKRSPDFGRNLHMEYGFKPPLVPSVEIDDKGVPLKAVADLTKGKLE